MKRIKIVIILLMLTCCINVKAEENKELENTFYEFFECFSTNNSNVYSYIDSSNEELNEKIKNNINDINISKDSFISLKEVDDEYMVGVKISGNGKVFNSNWDIEDTFVIFTFKDINGKYLLTDTNFFDKTGIDLLREQYRKLFSKVIIVSLGVFTVTLLVSYKTYKLALKEENTN